MIVTDETWNFVQSCKSLFLALFLKLKLVTHLVDDLKSPIIIFSCNRSTEEKHSFLDTNQKQLYFMDNKKLYKYQQAATRLNVVKMFENCV